MARNDFVFLFYVRMVEYAKHASVSTSLTVITFIEILKIKLTSIYKISVACRFVLPRIFVLIAQNVAI